MPSSGQLDGTNAKILYLAKSRNKSTMDFSDNQVERGRCSSIYINT